MKYLRRTASDAVGYGMVNTTKYLRGAAGNGLGTAGKSLVSTAKYLQRTASGAAGNSLS
jgi:hypothetical protein